MRYRPLLALTLLLVAAPLVRAQDTAFSNLTTYQNTAFLPGGAITTSLTTATVADDLTYSSTYAGQQVANFTYSVFNDSTASTTASAQISFFSGNGTSGGPGTLLAIYATSPTAFASGAGLYTMTLTSATTFALPTTNTIWAGISFSSGTTGATADQLNALGQGLYNAPTVGSSTDALFLSTSTATSTGSNPAGSFYSFGGDPVANLGWRIQVTPAPNASVSALLGLGVFGLTTCLRRRRLAATLEGEK